MAKTFIFATLRPLRCKVCPYKILSRDLDANAEIQDSRLQVSVLHGFTQTEDSVVFQEQLGGGLVVNPADLMVFMTAPAGSSREVNYVIDISSKPQNDVQEIQHDVAFNLYRDSKFATQKVQMM